MISNSGITIGIFRSSDRLKLCDLWKKKEGNLCQKMIVNIREGRHCVINGISAPSGDSFLGLDINDDCDENNISVSEINLRVMMTFPSFIRPQNFAQIFQLIPVL